MTEITDLDRLRHDLFQGEEGTLEMRKVSIQRAAKEHPCFFGLGSYGDGHKIKPGDRYRYEKALVDGDYWGQYHCCLPCLDKEIRLGDSTEGDDD